MNTPDEIVIVSGLPRSGTSLMMSMLQAGGMELLVDQVRPADTDNPKGYYEFEPVKALKVEGSKWLAQARGRAVKIVAPLLKYLPDDEHYKIVFMRRSIAEVLASQRQMLERLNKESDRTEDETLGALFAQQLDDVKQWMVSHPGVDYIYVDYASLIREPMPIVREIISFLGKKLDADGMQDMVDPTLYRQRQAD